MLSKDLNMMITQMKMVAQNAERAALVLECADIPAGPKANVTCDVIDIVKNFIADVNYDETMDALNRICSKYDNDEIDLSDCYK